MFMAGIIDLRRTMQGKIAASWIVGRNRVKAVSLPSKSLEERQSAGDDCRMTDSVASTPS